MADFIVAYIDAEKALLTSHAHAALKEWPQAVDAATAAERHLAVYLNALIQQRKDAEP